MKPRFPSAHRRATPGAPSRGARATRILAGASAALAIAALCGAPPAAAQDYTWTLAVMGGISAPLSESGGTEPGYQVGFGLQFEPGANVWARAGQVDFDTGNGVGQLTDGTIDYINFGGEYQFTEGYYDSGIYLGLGLYDLEARRILADGIVGPKRSDSVLGLVLGATGEFKITPSFVVLAEISGHVLDSGDLRVLGTGFAGFGFHY